MTKVTTKSPDPLGAPGALLPAETQSRSKTGKGTPAHHSGRGPTLFPKHPTALKVSAVPPRVHHSKANTARHPDEEPHQ